MSPQQIKGFRPLCAEQDADGFAMLLDLKSDMAKLLGLQKHRHPASLCGCVMGAELGWNRGGKGWCRCWVMQWGRLGRCQIYLGTGQITDGLGYGCP